MRSIPGTTTLALAVPALLVALGCGPVPWSMPDAEERALREQAELYALAARGFEALFGEWPSEVEDFEPYLPARPASERSEVRIESVEGGDDPFTMTFVYGASQARDEPGSVHGELRVWREGTVDRPAATLEWRYHGLFLDRSGEWTLRECGSEPHLEPC